MKARAAGIKYAEEVQDGNRGKQMARARTGKSGLKSNSEDSDGGWIEE
jgi:hypothetical protein